jgi:hypothetical protein
LGILGEGLLEAVKKKGQEAVRLPLCRSLAHLYVCVPAWATTQGCMGQRVPLIHVLSLSAGF